MIPTSNTCFERSLLIACLLSIAFLPHAKAQVTPSSLDASLQLAIDFNTTKLIRTSEITAPLLSGSQETGVIVLLDQPGARAAATDWDNLDSLSLLHSTNALEIDSALAQLPASTTTVHYRYDNFAGFSCSVDQKGLTILLNNPAVQSIEPITWMQLSVKQGIALMNAMPEREGGYAGQGIAIAIVDSGVDYNHPLLGGGGFPNPKVIGGYDFGDNDADPFPNGSPHGTSVAGIAAGDQTFSGDYIGGVAKNAKIIALKVSTTAGAIPDAAIIAAWDWCVTHKNDNPLFPILVINNSVAGTLVNNTCDANFPAMATAGNNAIAAGITILGGSGNDGLCSFIGMPACLSSLISVGAVYDSAFGNAGSCVHSSSCATKSPEAQCPTGFVAFVDTAADKVTVYSNTASFLTLLAPSHMVSTLTNGGGFVTDFGGTSAASPYAAGAVACLQSGAKSYLGHYLTPAQIRTALVNTGTPILDTKTPITKPRIDLVAAAVSLGIFTVPPPPTPTAPPPATNDLCYDAKEVCPGTVYFGDTSVSSSDDGVSSCGNSSPNKDIWYLYKPFVSGTAVFSTCGSTFYDSVISVHSGCPGHGGNQLACNDDIGTCTSRASEITMEVNGGGFYYIRVTGYQGAAGLSQFTVTGPICNPGTLTPTPTVSPSPTKSPTPTPSPTPTKTPTPEPTQTPLETPITPPPSLTPTPALTPPPTPTEEPTFTPLLTPPPPCGRIYGDFDRNGFTDLNDFLFLLDWWQLESPAGPPNIDLNDFLTLLDYWNTFHACA